MSTVIPVLPTYTAQDEIPKILHEIDILSSPDKIVARKTELLRKLNYMRSPVGKLPAEALSIIFELLAPRPVRAFNDEPSSPKPPREEYSPLLLGAVCAFWRAVATSTSSLWTSFRWDINSKERFPPSLLLIYLENSANRPLHLELSFYCDAPQDALVDPSVDQKLVPNLRRIRTLKLIHPPAAWDEYMNKLLSVVDLIIDHHGHAPGLLKPRGDLLLNRCHQLRRISLRSTEMAICTTKRFYRMPWSLTALHLHFIPIDTAIQTVCRYSDIVELHIGSAEDPHNDLDPTSHEAWFGEAIVFKRLKYFKWEYPSDGSGWDWLDAFMNVAQMPALQTLELIYEDPFMPRSDASPNIQDAFFRRLTKTIVTLRLEGIDHIFSFEDMSSGYPSLFSPDSTVESISLITHYNIDVLDRIIERLHCDSTSGTTTQMEMPKMRSLTLSRSYKAEGQGSEITDVKELGPRHCDSLAKILEQRLAGRNSFRLEFIGIYPDWRYGTQERLRSLVMEGTEVEIVEDGHFVDWLGEVVELV